MKPSTPPVTLVINSNSGTVTVRGLRSRKGWNIYESHGATSTLLHQEKFKEDAIRYATDACEPGLSIKLLVKPANA